jgi:hypothetical protein
MRTLVLTCLAAVSCASTPPPVSPPRQSDESVALLDSWLKAGRTRGGPSSRSVAGDQVAQVIRHGMPAVSDCYGKALKRDSSLAGTMVLAIAVGADGVVGAITRESNTLGDVPFNACIDEVVRRWRFPAPDVGQAIIRVPLVFSGGSADTLPVGLSRKQVQETMRRVVGAVQRCYDTHQVPGTVVVELTIMPDGSVARSEPTGPATPTARCVAAACRLLRFPPFGGPPLSILYPFVLR